MSGLSAFLAGNAEKIENKRVVISPRFKDENGEPIKWEIKALGADENDNLQRSCTVSVLIPGQRNQYTREVDQIKYAAAMLAAAVVYPNLNNAELQDSYGVKTPQDVLRKMLYFDEYNTLAREVAEFNKIEGLSELVDDAKN